MRAACAALGAARPAALRQPRRGVFAPVCPPSPLLGLRSRGAPSRACARAPPGVTHAPVVWWGFPGRRGGAARPRRSRLRLTPQNAAPRLRVASPRASLLLCVGWCCPSKGDHPPAPPVGGERSSKGAVCRRFLAVRDALLCLILPPARRLYARARAYKITHFV